MDVYYKVKPGSPTWKRVLEFEEKRDRVFEIQKKVLTKLGIATYKRAGFIHNGEYVPGGRAGPQLVMLRYQPVP